LAGVAGAGAGAGGAGMPGIIPSARVVPVTHAVKLHSAVVSHNMKSTRTI
jgi:hypothetical protein